MTSSVTEALDEQRKARAHRSAVADSEACPGAAGAIHEACHGIGGKPACGLTLGRMS
jgi:hypothetical protein